MNVHNLIIFIDSYFFKCDLTKHKLLDEINKGEITEGIFLIESQSPGRKYMKRP